jgi:acetyltransferase-like isoleucine patch superfamily enzyme
VVRRPYSSIVRDAGRSLATAYKLRDCAVVGAGARVLGRVWIHGEGRIVIGQGVLLDGTRAPIELHTEPGAELVIGDDAIVEGGTSIEATLAVTIGARAHVGMYCKMMDNHFHALVERDERPPARAVIVEEDVELGPHVMLVAGAHVGRGAIVEAWTVVGRSIEPNAVARGNPARTNGHGGINAR